MKQYPDVEEKEGDLAPDEKFRTKSFLELNLVWTSWPSETGGFSLLRAHASKRSHTQRYSHAELARQQLAL